MLSASLLTQSTGAQSITFSSVNAIHPLLTLTVNTGGVTTFGGAVGNTAPFPLALVTDSEGISGEKTVLGGGTVHATSVDFKDDVTLAANTVVTGATVTFEKTVNADSAANSWTLLVNCAGVTTFGGSVGNLFALSSLTTDDSGVTGEMTVLGTASASAPMSVHTKGGGQSFGDAVTLAANTTLTDTGSGAITFSQTIDSDSRVAQGH